jgi:Ca-activated chloride channel homolog
MFQALKNKLSAAGLCVAVFAFGQNSPIQGQLNHSGNGRLSILQIHPDSIPNISVLFRAEKADGQPYFGLSKSAMTVEENNKACSVISLKPLSQGMPIAVNMVLDHSGSMMFDMEALLKLGVFPHHIKADANGEPVFPKAYTPPIEHAKQSLSRFFENLDSKKDQIGLVGFSSSVDVLLQPTNQKTELNASLEQLKADGSTAFYDALMVALQNFNPDYSLKVIVALTDGMDNASVFTFSDVVDLANEKDIPIYIIGLGDVYTDSLDLLAKATEGQFFYAKSANLLDSTYQMIQNRIKAFYELTYTSPNLMASDSLRQIFIGFLAEDSSMLYDKQLLRLNPALRQRITEIAKEQEKIRLQNNLLSLAGFLSVSVLGAGLIFFAFRPRKKKSKSGFMVFPNPADTQTKVQIDTNDLSGQLRINSMQGNQILELRITTPETLIDTGSWPSGTYTATYTGANGSILQTRLIIQH